MPRVLCHSLVANGTDHAEREGENAAASGLSSDGDAEVEAVVSDGDAEAEAVVWMRLGRGGDAEDEVEDSVEAGDNCSTARD